MLAFTKRFENIGNVELTGEADVEWDNDGSEVIIDEIRIETRTGNQEFVLRRNVEGVIGVLFPTFERSLLEQWWDHPDVSGLYSKAARREARGL